MGQSAHCQRGGQSFEPEELSQQQFAHLAHTHLDATTSDRSLSLTPAQLIHHYSPLLEKLQQYDKKELVKAINERGTTHRTTRREERTPQRHRKSKDHGCKSVGTDQQGRQSKKLRQLKEECSRICKLREEYLQKSMAKTAIDVANRIHLHQSIFEPHTQKQSPSRSPQKGPL